MNQIALVSVFSVAAAIAIVHAQDAGRVTASAQGPGLGITWVRIAPGTFEMGCVAGDTSCNGDEKPNHRVTISRPFEVMSTVVTVGAFRAVGLSLPAQPAGSSDQTPVVNLSWEDAAATCRAIGRSGRLLTEAEWEFAARGGLLGALYPWGNQDPVDKRGAPNGAHLNPFSGRGPAAGEAVPVQGYAPNGFGLFDMVGNVRTWVADWFAENYYQQSPSLDPKGPSSGQIRSVRGGLWFDGIPVRTLRASTRYGSEPERGARVIGVRCARDVP
jgi:formylglycine-generating enzyme required for sulfatase activity